MAPWVGDEDDWWNYDIDRETEADVSADSGPIALFGPKVGSGGLLGSLSTKARTVGVVSADLATGEGPLNAGIEASTGVDTSDTIGNTVNDGLDLDDVDSPNWDPDDTDTAKKARWAAYLVMAAAALWLLRPILEIGANVSG